LPNPLFPPAVRLLGRAVDRAARRGNVPFHPTFVRSQLTGKTPPVARLVHGGRGGEIRLKIYLCIVMMATAEPYDIRQPPTPQTWARMLALPPETGPRRVTSNLRWLDRNDFIQLEPRPGNTAAIKLVSTDIKDMPYVRASALNRYIGIPIEFWTHGWILHLSATGIALLLALLDSQGGYSEPRYVTKERRDSYQLSHNIWTQGRKELERHGILTVRRAPQGSEFDYRRLRNLYRIDAERFKQKPGSAF
jgi:hypothetical protein